MKIALVGNMNNNYFAFLRYLRDAEVEADLFPFEDEYRHFSPDNDTWQIERWKPYIRMLPFTYYGHHRRIEEFDTEAVRAMLSPYDAMIGSGPSPAYLARASLRLDAFMPYKTGVEYYKDNISLRHPSDAIRIRRFNYAQRAALRATPYALNCDFRDITYGRIRRLGMTNIALPLPMVYVESLPEPPVLEPGYTAAIERIKAADFSVCHPGRHLWKRRWTNVVKGIPFINNNANDKVIQGFEQVVRRGAARNPLLVLFEYGPQVADSKALVRSHGLEEWVLWIPLSPRKVIMQIIPHCSIGIGDLVVGAWGGKAMEFLASGVPLVNPTSQEIRSHYKAFVGHDPPPFIDLRSPDDLGEVLEFYARDESARRRLASESRQWFEAHDGAAAAARVVDFLAQRVVGRR